MTDEPIADAEVVEDDTEPTTAALALRTDPSPMQLTAPIATEAQVVETFRRYEQLRHTIITPADEQNIAGKAFVKKSGWRKLAVVMGVSSEILERSYDRDARGRIVRAEVVVRATAPNGRFMDGLGLCDANERCCPMAYGPDEVCRQSGRHVHCVDGCNGLHHFSKSQHDIPATASTRALNRACADLFGFGEVSAEEVTETDEPLEPAKIEQIIAALNTVDDTEKELTGPNGKVTTTDRILTKRAFVKQLGMPNELRKGQWEHAVRFLESRRIKFPDPAQPSPPAESASDGSASTPPQGAESSGSEAGARSAVVGTAVDSEAPAPADEAPPPAPTAPADPDVPPAPSDDDVPPMAEPDADQQAAVQDKPKYQAPKVPDKGKPSTAQQRRTVGIEFRSLVTEGLAGQGDKAELVGIITHGRASSMVDTTLDEAAKAIVACHFLRNGDLAFAVDPDDEAGRVLTANNDRGADFLRQFAPAEATT